jgi:hypothetical protein
MKIKIGILTAVLILAIATPTFAQFFKTGSDLIPHWQAYKATEGPSATSKQSHDSALFMGYVTGVCDAVLQTDINFAKATSDQMTVGQVSVIVGKYLDDHPEEWHLSGAVIVRKALRKAFVKKTP